MSTFFGIDASDMGSTAKFELGAAPTTKEAQAVADEIYSGFVSGDVDKVELVYTKFVSLIAADPVIQTLLPLTPQVIPWSYGDPQLGSSFPCLVASCGVPMDGATRVTTLGSSDCILAVRRHKDDSKGSGNVRRKAIPPRHLRQNLAMSAGRNLRHRWHMRRRGGGRDVQADHQERQAGGRDRACHD